jgi:hypothetical protein
MAISLFAFLADGIIQMAAPGMIAGFAVALVLDLVFLVVDALRLSLTG